MLQESKENRWKMKRTLLLISMIMVNLADNVKKNEVPERKQSKDTNDFTKTEKSRKKGNTARKQSDGKKVIDVKDASTANEEDGKKSSTVSETQKEHSEGKSVCTDKDKIEKKKDTARKQGERKKVIDSQDTSTANKEDGRESSTVSETQKEHSEGMSDCTYKDKIKKKRDTARKQSERKKVIDVQDKSTANKEDGRESSRVSETQKEHSEGMSDCTDEDTMEKKRDTASKQVERKEVIHVDDASTANKQDGRESSRVSETQKKHSKGMSDCTDEDTMEKKRDTARKQVERKEVIDVQDKSTANKEDGRKSSRISETQKEHSEGMSDCADEDTIEKKRDTARKQGERKTVIDVDDASTANKEDGRESSRVIETQKEHSEGMRDYNNTEKARKKMNSSKNQSKGIAILSVAESSTINVKDKNPVEKVKDKKKILRGRVNA